MFQSFDRKNKIDEIKEIEFDNDEFHQPKKKNKARNDNGSDKLNNDSNLDDNI
jgi:hypothetical protein